MSVARRSMCAAAVGIAMMLSWAAPASAVHNGATTCRFDDGVVRLRLASQHSVRLLVNEGRIKYFDLSDSSRFGQCGSAHVRNTDRILISETVAGTTRLQFDQQLGRFGPGRTIEDRGVSEIEVRLGTLTDLWIMGRPRGERITIGSRGVNLNRDRDVDLIGTNLRQIHVWGFEGDDWISGRGGRGTGNAWRSGGLLVVGGDGDDILVGTGRGDVLDGDLGADRIYGRGGNDEIDGGQESDVLFGGAGRDVMWGGSWPDRIEGGAGDDSLFAADSQQDTVNGGDGIDRAETDDVDSVSNVESTTYGQP